MHELGFKITKNDLIAKVKQIQEFKLKNNSSLLATITSGKKWIRLFQKRHPIVVLKKAEKTDPKRLELTSTVLKEYFNNMREIRLKYNIPDHRIFNADETGLPLSPEWIQKIFSIKGKACYIRSNETKEQITMMVTIGSNGKMLPPLFIWRGKTFPLDEAEKLPENILVTATPKGFMTADIFTQWLQHMITYMDASKENPVLLILDAHQSCCNLDALLLAQEFGVHILCLPGGSTHLLQPLDKAIFKVFKDTYRQLLNDYSLEQQTLITEDKYTKWTVISKATEAMQKIMSEDRILDAFYVTGIVPYGELRMSKMII
jgi:hypothetical protein